MDYTYRYFCYDCGSRFEIIEYDDETDEGFCPHCGSTDFKEYKVFIRKLKKVDIHNVIKNEI